MAHVPLFASDEFLGSSARGLYGDVIQEIDWSVGRLVDALERTGQRENTLFLFTSDNGPWLSYGDHAGSAGHLREGKGTTFEGGVRVPCIASWPERIPAGRVCDEPWMTIDVLPTVAGLLGADLPELPIDGLDAWPLLAGEEGATAPHEALFFWYHAGDLEAVRSGRFKLHFPHKYRTMVGREPGRGGFPGKYDHSARTGFELYDLEADPGESNDVWAEHPGEVARLTVLADEMRTRLGDRLTKRKGKEVRAPGRLDDLRPPELRRAVVPGKAKLLLDDLERIAGIADAEAREVQLDGLWDALVEAQRVPFVAGGEALFLWRGEANTVALAGDHTGWDPRGAPLERLAPLDLWLRREKLPSDARVDYKLVVDGDWRLDPVNPLRQRGGFGDNSELQMPGYVPSPWVLRFRNVPEGRWLAGGEVGAGALGAIQYRVWAPPGVEEDGAYPTLYVLDGHEYADSELGALREVLDNLVAAGRIEPVLAVFVDPRVGGENRRGEHYLMNQQFARFLSGALRETVERVAPADPRREARGVIGTSLGGLCTAYLAVEAGDTFGLFAAQSPALQAAGGNFVPELRRRPPDAERFWVGTGTLLDTEDEARTLAAELEGLGIPVRYVEAQEGHSWGQWRAQLPDVLTYLFGDDGLSEGDDG
jgi:enterochelin esterase-like enzyme